MLKKNTLKAQVSNDLVHVHHNKPFTNSLVVAKEFEKRHDNVTAKIKARLNSENKEIRDFSLLNFKETTAPDIQNKDRDVYDITEDGFLELGMSFTGQKANLVRVRFIAAFRKAINELTCLREQRLTVDWQEARANSKCIRSTLTQVVQAYERLADKQGGVKINKKGKNTGRHYYSSITRRIYKELFGDGTLKNIRDRLDSLQLTFLSIVEQSCADEIEKLVEMNVQYHDIYQECVKRIIATVDGLSASRLTSASPVVKLAWENRI